jgi:hypothetical protein
MTAYANAKDKDNARFYFIADSEDEISKHCSERDYEILSRPKYVEPGMVCHHFVWVGDSPRPPIWMISRPYSKN